MRKRSASFVVRILLLLYVTVQLAGTALWGRDKTDVVLLKNGDRLTGEVKGLLRGKLSLSTDSMGTVQIKWPGVQSVTSQYVFEVEAETGLRVFGSLRPAVEERVEIVGEESGATLQLPSVVHMTPLESGFLGRLEGYLDLGFSFMRANRALQWTLGSEVSSHSRKRMIRATLSSNLNSRQDLESTSRNVLDLEFTRFFADRWLGSVLAQFTQNEELGLDLRSLFGGGVGRHLIQSNRSTLNATGGAVLTRERFTGPGRTNAEAYGSADLQIVSFMGAGTDLSTRFTIFPSLSDWGRVRMDMEGRFRAKFFKNFTWTASVFDNFDSDPPSEGAETNDFGVTTSLGWSF
ncbi:MAG: DUF481 domain-containing protein [Acidobacteriota bacterium]